MSTSSPTPRPHASPSGAPRGSAPKRTGLQAFLTPGWAIALICVIAFSYLAFSTLAPWQLGKNERTSATNQRLQEAVEKDPVPLSKVVPTTDSDVAEEDEWTHVRMQGSFDSNRDIVLRNRHVEGTLVYQILTPFHTDKGVDIIVNRGFVAPTNAGKIPDYPKAEKGTVELTGYLRLDESAAEEKDIKPAEFDGQTVVNSISAAVNEKATGKDLVKGYVQLDEESIQSDLHAVALPQLESGPYLSYGIQWIAFGIIAPLGLGWFVYSELRERRREKQEQSDLQDSSADNSAEVPVEESIDSVQEQPAIDRKLADRYGRKASQSKKPKSGGDRF